VSEQLAKSVDELTPKQFKSVMKPLENPLLDLTLITTKKKRQVMAKAGELVNTTTGEIERYTEISKFTDYDEEPFVKVFTGRISEVFELGKAAKRVFEILIVAYHKTPMTKGYSEFLELYWYNGGIDGKQTGMSVRTFQRGLTELIQNQIIWPRTPTTYWVNPAILFKGSRVRMIQEMRKKKTNVIRDPNTIDIFKGKTDKELDK
jgi:hypothetical protein